MVGCFDDGELDSSTVGCFRGKQLIFPRCDRDYGRQLTRQVVLFQMAKVGFGSGVYSLYILTFGTLHYHTGKFWNTSGYLTSGDSLFDVDGCGRGTIKVIGVVPVEIVGETS